MTLTPKMATVRNLLATGQSHAAIAKTLGVSRQRVGAMAQRLRSMGTDPTLLLQQFLESAARRDMGAARAALAALGGGAYAALVPAAQALLDSLPAGAASFDLDGWDTVPADPPQKDSIPDAWAADNDE